MSCRFPARSGCALAAFAVAVLATGCTIPLQAPPEFALYAPAAEETAPLGGTALAQRRVEMERAHRDLVQFHRTLESLHFHDDRRGLQRLARFIDAYMGLHLDRLLRHEWQSRHPELMGLDANLRLVQADVLIRMDAGGRARAVIKDIEQRFSGREGMLVDYPIGRQSTLEQGLEILESGRWEQGYL